MHINDKIEEIKDLLEDLNADAQKLLSLAQMGTAAGEVMVQRVSDRVQQLMGIFSDESTPE